MLHLKDTKCVDVVLNRKSFVTIFEKVDGSSLWAVKNGNKINFFGRNKYKEIDKIVRMTSTMYDNAIEHLTSRLKKIPGSFECQFEYFPPNIDTHSILIKPLKNNLILLYSNIPNFSSHFASMLDVTYLAPIKTGYLTQDQIDELKKFDVTDVKFLSSLYKPFCSPVEGIIIQSGYGIFKITSKRFTEQIKKDNVVDLKKSRYYRELGNILSMLDFNNNLDDYVSIIFDAVVRFLSDDTQFKKCVKIFDEYDQGALFTVKFTDIKWEEYPVVILPMMKKYPWVKDFVRLALLNFRSIKKRSNLFTKDQLKIVNSKVMEIKHL